jgi:hypothetical protein
VIDIDDSNVNACPREEEMILMNDEMFFATRRFIYELDSGFLAVPPLRGAIHNFLFLFAEGNPDDRPRAVFGISVHVDITFNPTCVTLVSGNWKKVEAFDLVNPDSFAGIERFIRDLKNEQEKPRQET